MSFTISGGAKLQSFFQRLEDQARRSCHAKVGVFEGATYADGTPVVTVAAAQELGTATIPARSFLRRTVAEKSDQWPEALKQVMNAHQLNLPQAMDALGLQVSDEVRNTIAEIEEPPLADSTIRARTRKGSENPAKPLQDTLTLTNSVRHQVEDGDGS